ncbi:unnamed protein product [Periconia digitata]|uniref:Uncharacterized protein n=1 Tax=Periconia digitata TaxID=1303443 RepID=A0A9W4XLI1_9PLEO|nr:unnamed protein product [Periconia digitata]
MQTVSSTSAVICFPHRSRDERLTSQKGPATAIWFRFTNPNHTYNSNHLHMGGMQEVTLPRTGIASLASGAESKTPFLKLFVPVYFLFNLFIILF